MTKGRSRFEYICTVCMYTYVHCCCKMVQWTPRSLGWRSLATSAIGQHARKQAQKCMLSSSCPQFEFAASPLNEYIKIIRGRFLHTTLMPDDEWTKMYKDLKRRISKAKRMAKTMQQQQQQQPQLRQSQTRERDSEIERELKLESVCWPWNHHSYPFHLPSPIVSANHLQTRVIKPKVFFTAANGSVYSNLSSYPVEIQGQLCLRCCCRNDAFPYEMLSGQQPSFSSAPPWRPPFSASNGDGSLHFTTTDATWVRNRKKKLQRLQRLQIYCYYKHAHTHTLVQVLHMLQESSSANSFSKTEVQTTTISWRHQTPRIIQSRVKIYMEIPQKHEDKSKKEDWRQMKKAEWAKSKSESTIESSVRCKNL